MSIYTQQANNLMERLPINEQQFIVEFIKKISVSYKANTNESNLDLIHQKQKKAVKKFLETLNSVEPLADDEFDEILTKGITMRTPEELELL